MTVNRADGTAYGDLPASRLVTLFGTPFTPTLLAT